MKVLFTDNENKYDVEFIDVLIRKIRNLFFERLNRNKLIPFEVFINENPEFNSLYKKSFSAYEICLTAMYNLKVIKYGIMYNIEIDSTAKLPGTDIKLIQLCELINDGNLVLKAYPIFSDVFKEIQSKIEEYYAEYILEEE